MPCFRGIDVFIGTDPEPGRLPEFPHPDSSSVRLLLPEHVRSLDSHATSKPQPQPQLQPQPQPSIPAFATEPDLTRVARANARISVYIPSLPGARFWIQYAVAHPPKPMCHLYFKLSMNGRNVTNWGINPATTPTGTVAKGLYEPDSHWGRKEERGAVAEPEGIETRFFQFAAEMQDSCRSLAEEGGHIEVEVFRAKGRRRREPRLERLHSQDKYGISTPSGGIVQKPEDITYYDWLLVDPRDSPYATFCFHYRSWASLKLLHLVVPTKSNSSFGFSSPPGTKGTHNEWGKGSHETEKCPPRKPAAHPLSRPPEIFPAKSSCASRVVQPSKEMRDGVLTGDLNRPLPPIPLRPAPLKRLSDSSPRQRMLVTPPSGALGDASDCEVEYGAAATVAVRGGSPWRPLKARLVDIQSSRSEASLSGRKSPPHFGTSKPSPTHGTDRSDGSDPDIPAAGTLTLSESEWLKSSTTQFSRQTKGSASPQQSNSSPDSKLKVDNQARAVGFPPPRGLLGDNLTQIPLRGESGDLMKKLRSKDPFSNV